jgi:hypothetical protein
MSFVSVAGHTIAKEDTDMKGLQKTALLVAAGTLCVWGLAFAGEGAWFDMEGCSFCKYLIEDPELLDHMTWEQHSISNGIISVTMVEEEYAESFATCSAKMAKAGEEAMQGKQMPMCNSCAAFGKIMMQGPPKSEKVEMTNGEIWIMTSEDAEVVAQMQKWAKKNMAELSKMHTHGS